MRDMAVVHPPLRIREPPTPPRAVVLVLHGGRARSTRATRPWHPAVLRMIPFARALSGSGGGLVVARLRYRVRGWNGQHRSPVPDARWALGRLAGRYPGLPVALVGHSMGGRVALAVADEPGVHAVVALAPWIEPGEPAEPVAGRRVLIAHGTRDHTTDPAASATFARRANTAYVSVRGSGHAMLRRAGLWHGLATAFVLAALPDARVSGAGDVSNLVRRALAGEPSLVV